MQSAVSQKPANEKSNTSEAIHVSEVKKDVSEELGADAGIPVFLQNTTSSGSAPPPEIQRKCDACEEELVEDSPRVQPKLNLGAADDEYEREADQVAATVMRKAQSVDTADSLSVTEPLVQRTCRRPAIQRLCSACERKLEQPRIQRLCSECAQEQADNEDKPLRRKPESSSRSKRLDNVQRLVRSPGAGNTLSQGVRSRTESVLGSDLSGVRVHSDANAQRAAKDISARAFTYGNHIFLGPGQSSSDLALMAHELTHTVQQGASPRLERKAVPQDNLILSKRSDGVPDIQRLDWPDIDIPGPGDVWDAAESAYDTASDAASDAYDTASDIASDAYDTVSDTASDVYDSVSDAASDAYDTASDIASDVYDVASDAASDAIDWMASQAGALARQIVGALGGSIRITRSGIEVIIPRKCLDALHHKHEFDEISKELSAPIFALPIAPGVFVTGSVGIKGTIVPELQIQLGPLCLNAIRILINPLTASASISGGVSLTSALSLGAELRGGLTGELGLKALVPIPGPPYVIPITAPVVGLEGGIAGMLRGIAAQTTTLGGSLSLSGTTIGIGNSLDLDMGLGADLFLGAYGQLSLLGENVCRIYWEPFEWHGGIGASLGLSSGLSIIPGFPTLIAPRINPPTLTSLPFNQFPLVIERSGFSDDCPIKDQICKLMNLFNLFPTQRGGNWDWLGSYGPGPQLIGPLPVWARNPGRASGAICRGACGADCDTCEAHPIYRFVDPHRGETWEYTNFEICNSHPGCREHDAGFDWAADVHGETGSGAMFMPWHMAANLECACTYPAGNCAAWVAGLPPYDRTMYFADRVVRLPPGTAPGGGGPGGGDDEDGLGPLRNRLALAICKCVGDNECGGGNIYRMCFTINDKICKSKGDLQREADSRCNNTEVMKEKCKRPKCYYRHTDARCPVKEDDCDDGYFPEGANRRSGPATGTHDDHPGTPRAVPMLPPDIERDVVRYIEEGRYAQALSAAVSGLPINGTLCYFHYVARSDAGEGLTTTNYRIDPSTGLYVPSGRSEVEIYTPAFATASWLVSTIMHEYQHVLQHQRAMTGTELSDPTGEHEEAGEVDAYLWEVENAIDTGMAADLPRLLDTWARARQHYEALGNINPARQATFQARYEAAEEFMNDIQTGAPRLPGYQHVYHHGTDYDTAQTVYSSDIDARGDIDFGLGFYTHTRENWHLAKEWALRRAVGTGSRGWGVITFPVPDNIWDAHINSSLTFEDTGDRPANAPVNPRTGSQMNWRQFVRYNFHERENTGVVPDWGGDYDVISGPLYGRRYENTDIRQMMFTSGGTPMLNIPLVKRLRILVSKLFRRRRR